MNWTVNLLALIFCAGAQAGVPSTFDDVISIIRRADGLFDVVCRSGRREVATADQLQHNDVCNNNVPEPGNELVQGQDISIVVPDQAANLTVWEFGKNIWEGYVSFQLSAEGSELGGFDRLYLVDGLGGRWELRPGVMAFQRLASPVKIIATTDSSIRPIVKLTEIFYEITKTSPILGQDLKSRVDSLATFATLGADIPGVEMSFFLQARFYRNFVTDNCSQVLVIDDKGTSILITPQAAHGTGVRMIAPVRIQTAPLCMTSRLTDPENRDTDVLITIPVIQVGKPI